VETAERSRTRGESEVLRLSEYGKSVIDERKIGGRTRIECNAKWSQLI
jgi:hypothetical protein